MIFLSWLTTWCTVHNILLKITQNILLCIVKIPHFHSFLVNIFKEEQRQSLKTLGITKNLMQWWATLVYEMSLLYLSSQGCRNWRQISCYLSVQSRWCSSCLGIVNHHSVRIYCTWGSLQHTLLSSAHMTLLNWENDDIVSNIHSMMRFDY